MFLCKKTGGPCGRATSHGRQTQLISDICWQDGPSVLEVGSAILTNYGVTFLGGFHVLALVESWRWQGLIFFDFGE